MIKKFLGLSCFALLFMAANCDNEPYEEGLLTNDNSCDLAIIAAANAADDLVLSTGQNFSLLCQVYKETLQDQIEACGDATGDLQALISSLGNCVLEDDVCGVAQQNTLNASVAFENAANADYESLCNAYRDALLDEIEACGDVDGSLQSEIDSLEPCSSNTNNLCEDAIALTMTAQVNFLNASDSSYLSLCGAYKTALQNQIESCGDENGSLQEIIDGLGNCSPDVVEIVGEWRLIGWISNNPQDIDNDGEETNNFLAEMDCYNDEFLIFNEGGTGLFYQSSYANFTFTPIEGSNDDVDFFVECIEIDQTRNFVWVQNGNEVSITFDDGSSIDYLKSINVISLFIENGFTATSTIDNTTQITEDIAFAYLKQ